MVLQGQQIVKPNNPNAYITKIGARQHQDGVIHGLAFEYSDGSKVNLSEHNGLNSDPYEIDTDLMRTEWLVAENGFDTIEWGSFVGGAIKSLKILKGGNLIASNNVSGKCCRVNKYVNVLPGQLISVLVLEITYMGRQSFHFRTAYGVLPPEPVDGGWSSWSEWSECEGDCSVGSGIHKSARVCNNPVPIGDGAKCFGNAIRYAPCDLVCPTNGANTTPDPNKTPDPISPMPEDESWLEKNIFWLIFVLVIVLYLYTTSGDDKKVSGASELKASYGGYGIDGHGGVGSEST